MGGNTLFIPRTLSIPTCSGSRSVNDGGKLTCVPRVVSVPTKDVITNANDGQSDGFVVAETVEGGGRKSIFSSVETFLPLCSLSRSSIHPLQHLL